MRYRFLKTRASGTRPPPGSSDHSLLTVSKAPAWMRSSERNIGMCGLAALSTSRICCPFAAMTSGFVSTSILGEKRTRTCSKSFPLKTRSKFAGFLKPSVDHRKWDLFVAVAEFIRAPSAKTLANLLDLSANHWPAASYSVHFIPWPASSLIRLASDPNSVRALAIRVRSGAFGDTDDWLRAEKRWQQNGIVADDLERWANSGEFFGADVANIGAPSSDMLSLVTSRRRDNQTYVVFLTLFRKATAKPIKRSLARLLMRGIGFSNDSFLNHRLEVMSWLIDNDEFVHPEEIIMLLVNSTKSNRDEVVSLIDRAGKRNLSWSGSIPIAHGIEETSSAGLNAGRWRSVTSFQPSAGLLPFLVSLTLIWIDEYS